MRDRRLVESGWVGGALMQIQHVDQFIQHVNVSMRQRHDYKQLSIIVDRIESYDAIDLPSDECLKVSDTV